MSKSTSSTPASPQLLFRGIRLWLIVDSVVVFIAGVQLFVLADHTK